MKSQKSLCHSLLFVSSPAISPAVHILILHTFIFTIISFSCRSALPMIRNSQGLISRCKKQGLRYICQVLTFKYLCTAELIIIIVHFKVHLKLNLQIIIPFLSIKCSSCSTFKNYIAVFFDALLIILSQVGSLLPEVNKRL